MKRNQIILALCLFAISVLSVGCDFLEEITYSNLIQGSWAEVNNDPSDESRINLFLRVVDDELTVATVSPTGSVSCTFTTIDSYDGEILNSTERDGTTEEIPLRYDDDRLTLGGVFVFEKSSGFPRC